MGDAQSILQELTFIRWLVVGIGFLMLFLVGVFYRMLHTMDTALQRLQAIGSSGLRHREIVSLLNRNKLRAAKYTGKEWIAQEPGNADAHMLLAKTQVRLNEWIEAKANLERVVELAPDQEVLAKPWLDRVNEAIQEHRPRSID